MVCKVPVFPSYRNQSIDLLANQLAGFSIRATLALNGLKRIKGKTLEDLPGHSASAQGAVSISTPPEGQSGSLHLLNLFFSPLPHV